MSVDSTIDVSFWRRVNVPFLGADDCWEWTGKSRHRFGYGALSVQGRMFNSHRLSWLLVHGPIAQGLCVLHRCDNPKCVRPSHLFLGTKSENSIDRHAKGRTSTKPVEMSRRPHGARNCNARLTPESALVAKMLCAAGFTRTEIAAAYGVSLSTIGRVVSGDTWAYALENAQ